MNKFSKFYRRVILALYRRKFFKFLLTDKQYLQCQWACTPLGEKWLDLKTPRTFNEKLQWLKLYNRNPLYTRLVDKYEAKVWAETIIGEEHIIKTLGVYNDFSEIDFDKLPNQFVIKCTHDSGSVVICKDKHNFDKQATKEILQKGLQNNFYYNYREWPYKNVRPRIIVEEYMENKASYDLPDYKFFCFDGVVRAMFIATERQNKEKETSFDFFDDNFNHLDFTNGHPNAEVAPEKPLQFDEMKTIAGKLSKDLPHVRVDLYEINGRIYFGEMTFFHWGGLVPFNPPEWDYKFGEWLTLPQKY